MESSQTLLRSFWQLRAINIEITYLPIVRIVMVELEPMLDSFVDPVFVKSYISQIPCALIYVFETAVNKHAGAVVTYKSRISGRDPGRIIHLTVTANIEDLSIDG